MPGLPPNFLQDYQTLLDDHKRSLAQNPKTASMPSSPPSYDECVKAHYDVKATQLKADQMSQRKSSKSDTAKKVLKFMVCGPERPVNVGTSKYWK